MKKVVMTLIDDMAKHEGAGTEVPADRSVTFQWIDGKRYTIDLSEANFKRFEAQMTPWVTAATRVRSQNGHQPESRRVSGRRHTKSIREWAKANGLAVSDRGRIPVEVLRRHEAAHKGG